MLPSQFAKLPNTDKVFAFSYYLDSIDQNGRRELSAYSRAIKEAKEAAKKGI